MIILKLPLLIGFGLPAAPEWVFLSSLALLLLGPKKMPQLARQIANIMGEFQKAQEAFRRELLGVPQLPELKQSAVIEQYHHQASKEEIHN